MKIISMFGGNLNTPYEFQVMQGDVLDILPELPVNKFDLIIADPPYNTSKAGGRGGFKGKKFIGKDESWDVIQDYPAFSKDWMEKARGALKDNGTFYVWGYHRSIPHLPLSSWYVLNMIVWHKTNAFPTTMQNSVWSPSCEYALWLRKEAGKNHTFHIGKQDFARDFFQLPVVTNKRHPSEKPYRIIKEFVRRSTNEGDLVLDLFSGSGGVLEACIELKRRCISIELSSKYYSVIRDRAKNIADILDLNLE